MHALMFIALVSTVAAQGDPMACMLSQGNGTQHYGALGKSVFLHLAGYTKGLHIQLKKDNSIRVLKAEAENNKWGPEYKDRSEFFANGTFRLDRAAETDSGEYRWEIFNSAGKKKCDIKIRLDIQAPVSKPRLSPLCLSHGETRVSCSSEDRVSQYHWSLDGQTLDRDMAYMSRQGNTIILKGSMTGALTCTIHNQVSNNSNTIQLPACPAPVSKPRLSPICLSHGEMRVLCSSEDRVSQYHWSLGGQTLDRDMAYMSRQSNTIILKGSMTGALTCTIHNQVSNNSNTIQLPACPVVYLAVGALASLFTLVVGICCLCKTKKVKSDSRGDAPNEEIEYADVNLIKKRKREKKEEEDVVEEMEVEYGQVRVAGSRDDVAESPADQVAMHSFS